MGQERHDLTLYRHRIEGATNKPKMNAKTLEAVTRHGNALLAAFPNATEKNPVALCKKLRRIECAISKTILAFSSDGNSGITQDTLDHEAQMALIRTGNLLGLDKHGIALAKIIVNRDPRGYALKIDSGDGPDWFSDWQEHERNAGRSTIHEDWGKNGILAPDLTVED